MCCTASCPVEATARAAAKVGWPKVSVRPSLECGRWGGWASSVTAQFDVRLRGLDVINHGAELVNEAHQSHVNTLADGLAGYCEIAVKGVVVAPIEVMEGERSCSGALWCTGWLFHHHCIQAEGLNEQSRLKLQWRKVHQALSSNIKKTYRRKENILLVLLVLIRPFIGLFRFTSWTFCSCVLWRCPSQQCQLWDTRGCQKKRDAPQSTSCN